MPFRFNSRMGPVASGSWFSDLGSPDYMPEAPGVSTRGMGHFSQRASQVGSYVSRQANRARNYLATGPLNNWALNKAFEDPTSYIRGGAGSRKLARLAGRRSLYSRVFSGPAHQTGMNWTRDMLGTGHSGVAGSSFTKAGTIAKHSILGRAIGPAFLTYAGYEGYKKEGAWGAVKGVGGALAETYLVGRAISAFGAPALGVLGAAAGVSALGAIAHDPDAFLSMKGWVRPWTSEYHKKTQGVQMGGEVVDPHGINATMRQRSMLAIQNSRMNARSGLGQEATLTFSPYFS